MKMKISEVSNKLFYSPDRKFPESTEIIGEYAVQDERHPLGAVLIRFKSTGMYALFSGGAVSSCNQSEARRIHLAMTGETPPFKALLNRQGVKMSEVSRLCGIPYRTLQGWAAGEREPQPWLLDLIERRIQEEKGRTADQIDNDIEK